MANERTWEASAASKQFTNIAYIAGDVAAESNGVLRTAPVLYLMKEALVECGWEVVSSSYRTDATGSVYPIQSATYGQNLTSGNMTTFQAVAGDSWKIFTASLHVGDTAYSEESPIPIEQMHRIIYPVAYNSASALNPVGVDGSVRDTGLRGRSWCLLKHVDYTGVGLKQNESGADLYLVLDYVSSNYQTTAAASSSIVSPTIENSNQLFGHSINIVYFYGTPSNAVAPTPQIRPYRNDELTFSRQKSTNRISNNGNVLINPLETAAKSIKINYTCNTDYGGFYIFVSQNSKPTFILGADKVGDSISDVLTSKANVGNVIFTAYSVIARSAFNIATGPTLSHIADLFMSSKGTSGGANNYAPYSSTWGQVTFYNPIKYFRLVDPAGSSQAADAFSTFPTYCYNDPSPSIGSIRGLLSLTANNSSAARDGTYLEFPLPILDAVDDVTKIRYAGRFVDVKLGPANGIDGALAKEESTSPTYDRILLGGLWFPYGSDSPADL